VVIQTQKQLEQDKATLQSTSQAYKAAFDELTLKEVSFKEQYSALQEKEVVLREGFAQMKLSAAELSQRERSLSEAMHLIERRKTDLDQADHDVQLKRLTAAASYRQWSSKQTVDSLALAHTSANGSYQGHTLTDAALYSPSPDLLANHSRHILKDIDGHQLVNDENLYKIVNYGSHGDMNSRAIHESTAHMPPPPPPLPHNKTWLDALQSKLKASPKYASGIPVEVRAAQSTLRQLRGHMSKVDASSSSVQRLLDDEADFLKALHRKNNGSNL